MTTQTAATSTTWVERNTAQQHEGGERKRSTGWSLGVVSTLVGSMYICQCGLTTFVVVVVVVIRRSRQHSLENGNLVLRIKRTRCHEVESYTWMTFFYCTYSIHICNTPERPWYPGCAYLWACAVLKSIARSGLRTSTTKAFSKAQSTGVWFPNIMLDSAKVPVPNICYNRSLVLQTVFDRAQ